MNITFLGAAGAVTGSCHMIETENARFCIDCGMHQGNQEIEERNWALEPYRPKDIDFILLTHAHIDHSGLAPRMVREGFDGPIYCTGPTADLLEIMLADSAHIQQMEAEWAMKKRRRKGDNRPVEPLYDQDDAARALSLLTTADYGKGFSPAPGITVTYCDAGHILGSAFLHLSVEEGEGRTRCVFSGDLGRPNQLIVSDPDTPEACDYLFMESTYGDRNHKDENTSREELAQAIAYSYAQGEKVIIPAFAVERSQEIIYSLYLLAREGKLPEDMPVYLDSPLAIRATEIFRKNRRHFDAAAQKIYDKGDDPLNLPNLKYTSSTQESMAINAQQGPAVVISASGMCNAGRVKHHLKHNLHRPGASVVFVGFQAKGTPGRRIVDGHPHVRLFGEDVAVKAKVWTIGGFSGHAGQSQMLDWLKHFTNPEMEVFLVHGERKAQEVFARLIAETHGFTVRLPAYLESCELAPGRLRAPALARPEALAAPLRQRGAVPYPVDWDYVLADAEAKLAELKARIPAIRERGWEDQSDARRRLAEITGELVGLISEFPNGAVKEGD